MFANLIARRLIKKLIKCSIILSYTVVTNLTFAEDSSLIVKNKMNHYDIEIKVDLLCGMFKDTHLAARYTTNLDENPIRPHQIKVATWKNCILVDKKFFALWPNDHSKIYIKIRNIISDISAEVIRHAERGGQPNTTTLNFDNKNFNITITHNGNYSWHKADATQTYIAVDNDSSEKNYHILY